MEYGTQQFDHGPAAQFDDCPLNLFWSRIDGIIWHSPLVVKKAILDLDGKEELKVRKKGAITQSRSDFFIGDELWLIRYSTELLFQTICMKIDERIEKRIRSVAGFSKTMMVTMQLCLSCTCFFQKRK
jgi:hypothetical protein